MERGMLKIKLSLMKRESASAPAFSLLI